MKKLIFLMLSIPACIFSIPTTFADVVDDSTIAIQQRNIEISGSQGQLTAYPSAICQLQNAESIALYGHNFAEIPECIGQHSRTLRQLRLSNNGIGKLAQNLFQLKFLENLQLDNNKFSTKATDNWSGLSKIQNLNLSNNQTITELPISIGSLTTLEILSLANTKISGLPDSFSNLTSLRVLDLSNTNISITPKAFSSLVNLQTLTLVGVPLTPAEKNVINAIFKGRQTVVNYQ